MKKYKVIYADPAWEFKNSVYQDNGRKDRLLNEQYPSMTKNELQQLSVKNIADKDCALFLWVTDSHLKEGIELMESWGFTYRTIVFIWKKITNKGNTYANVGAWTMKNCEICILGVKGNMLQYKKANNIFQLIEAERTKHSKKPVEVIERIEMLFGDLSKIELFCRYPRKGWDVWGNEVESDVVLMENLFKYEQQKLDFI
jgi:site-specific DNA-methyltransferase (adenine-specific)